MKYKKKIITKKDKRGYLISFEVNNFKYFKIKRFFFINFLKKNIIRGNHAHKKCSQFIICSSGKVKINLTTVSNQKKTFILNGSYSFGIYVKPYNWIVLESLKKNTQVICLADKVYDKKEYIKDIELFKNKIF